MDLTRTEVISDIEVCKRLWSEFSPNNTVYDRWDFRIEFWKVYEYKPHFVVLSDGPNRVGLLPLWYVPEQNSYFWFGDTGDGSNWQEDTNFWVKDARYLKPLLEACPAPVTLYNLTSDCFKTAENLISFQKHNPKNILPIGTFRALEDYLATLKRKLRGNLVRDCRAIEALNPKIRIDDFGDFDTLIQMNIIRHKESMFKDPRVGQVFKGVIKAASKDGFQARMLSVFIDDKPAGFDFVLICNGIYCPLLCAYDVLSFPGIGNFMSMYDIKDAIALGMQKVDFAEGDEDCYKNKLFPMIEQYKIKILKP